MALAKTCTEEENTMRKEEAGRGDINYQSEMAGCAEALCQLKQRQWRSWRVEGGRSEVEKNLGTQ